MIIFSSNEFEKVGDEADEELESEDDEDIEEIEAELEPEPTPVTSRPVRRRWNWEDD